MPIHKNHKDLDIYFSVGEVATKHVSLLIAYGLSHEYESLQPFPFRTDCKLYEVRISN